MLARGLRPKLGECAVPDPRRLANHGRGQGLSQKEIVLIQSPEISFQDGRSQAFGWCPWASDSVESAHRPNLPFGFVLGLKVRLNLGPESQGPSQLAQEDKWLKPMQVSTLNFCQWFDGFGIKSKVTTCFSSPPGFATPPLLPRSPKAENRVVADGRVTEGLDSDRNPRNNTTCTALAVALARAGDFAQALGALEAMEDFGLQGDDACHGGFLPFWWLNTEPLKKVPPLFLVGGFPFLGVELEPSFGEASAWKGTWTLPLD